MLKKLIHFIKYHNAFSIIFTIVFVGSGFVFAASPEVKDAFVSSQETVQSVDNSGIISIDLDNFNFGLQIKSVTEDGNNYYIVYAYKTMAVEDYVWQEVQKENTMTVSKEALSNQDLGLYVAEELGENIDYELSYLKEVQQIEKEKGLTQKIVATEYAGLIGQFLNTKEKVFPEYQPVVQEPAPTPEIVEETTSTSTQEKVEPPIAIGSIDRESLRKMIQELLAQQQGQTQTPAPTQGITPATEPKEPTSTTSEPEATSTSETATSTKPVCTPNWQCSDWQPLPEIQTCGQTFTQTRTCADSNNCGTEEGKPIETQDPAGNFCSAQNATGACQSGTCNFSCAEGFSNCDNDWSNGCEIQLETATSTCP